MDFTGLHFGLAARIAAFALWTCPDMTCSQKMTALSGVPMTDAETKIDIADFTESEKGMARSRHKSWKPYCIQLVCIEKMCIQNNYISKL